MPVLLVYRRDNVRMYSQPRQLFRSDHPGIPVLALVSSKAFISALYKAMNQLRGSMPVISNEMEVSVFKKAVSLSKPKCVSDMLPMMTWLVFIKGVTTLDLTERLKIDRYPDENGNIVFTERFLINRGGCCGLGCRHCPYRPRNKAGNKNVSDKLKTTMNASIGFWNRYWKYSKLVQPAGPHRHKNYGGRWRRNPVAFVR